MHPRHLFYSYALIPLHLAVVSAFATLIVPTDHGPFTFALSAANTGDVYIHLSAPATSSWVAVGTGSSMVGSVMWVIYPARDDDDDDDAIVLSPRLSSAHVEPSYSDHEQCSLQPGSNRSQTIGHSRYYSANIHCTNLTSLGSGDGKLNLTSTQQPFIYAWGPKHPTIASSSKSAGIKRHVKYGNFWMDMTQATTTDVDAAAIPSGAALASTTNAGADGNPQSDGDKVDPAHAAVMLTTFVIIFPLGVVLLRLLEGVKAHYMTQTLGILLALAGLGLGINLSMLYNHSKHFSSGHQIFGLILIVLLLAQWTGGLLHHLRFRKHARPTLIGKIHRILGPAVLLGGIINGFTGFNFASESHNNVYLGIAVAVILVIVLSLLAWKRWSKKRHVNEINQSKYEMNVMDRQDSAWQ